MRLLLVFASRVAGASAADLTPSAITVDEAPAHATIVAH
jgi:hypothetical protein